MFAGAAALLLSALPIHAQRVAEPAEAKTRKLYYARDPLIQPAKHEQATPQGPDLAPNIPSPAEKIIPADPGTSGGMKKTASPIQKGPPVPLDVGPPVAPLPSPKVIPAMPQEPSVIGEQGSASKPGIRPAAIELPKGIGDFKDDGTKSYVSQFGPPQPETLFLLEGERALKERIRQEARTYEKLERVTFPEDPVLSKEKYQGRMWPAMYEIVEPSYVCYGRTYFDQKNFERYGWEIGWATPLVCAGKFYADAFFLPYKMGTDPFRHYECNSGYCLPGDPTPFYWYPPKLSATGFAAQASALTGAFFIFP